MTGLPEYRNGIPVTRVTYSNTADVTPGGLLIDFGVLSLKPGVLPQSLYPDPQTGIPRLLPSHPAIVEWRAMTVIELYVHFTTLSRTRISVGLFLGTALLMPYGRSLASVENSCHSLRS